MSQPKSFQDELASKLGLGGQIAKQRESDGSGDNWDTESIQENETATASHKSKKKADDTTSIASRRSTMSKTLKSKKHSDSFGADSPNITSKKEKKKRAASKKIPAKDSDEGCVLLFLFKKKCFLFNTKKQYFIHNVIPLLSVYSILWVLNQEKGRIHHHCIIEIKTVFY